MLRNLRERLALVLLATLLLESCTKGGETAGRTPEDFLALLQPSSSSSSAAASSVHAQPTIESGTTLDIGATTAPLTLVLFTNPSCAYCRQFHEDIFPMLKEEYIGSGRLLLRTVILPIRKYPMSGREAAALFCAHERGKGEKMLGALFALPRHDDGAILEKAGALGMDVGAFAQCLASPEASAYAAAQASLARAFDVSLVPTLILNGEKQVGLPRYADLRGWLRR